MAALFQIAGSSLPQVYGWGEPIGARSLALDTDIVPAGWAFSIWGIIFIWSLIFALYAASRSVDRAALADKITWPAIGAFSMNGVWGLYTPFFGLTILSEIIILLGLFCALFAALASSRFPAKTASERFLIAAPLGLVAGWLTAASFVGGSSVLLGQGVEMTNVVMVSILGAATVFAGFIILNRPSPTYAFAIFWALAAVISKNLDGGNQTIIYAAATAIAALVLVTLYSLKRRSV
ncbi:MAG: hypothetical protein HKP25_05925 [Marinicaulis sp.]|nr:hypothetical protein [Marinicaulis sp.]